MSTLAKDGKIRVLFVCVHNSARSQMAEAFLSHLGGDRFEAESAGLEPTEINPLVIEAMKEIDIDISSNRTNSVFDFFKQGRLYRYVVTVCDEASAERCPLFASHATYIHWPFENPATFTGSYDERLGKIRDLRDRIKKKVEKFITEHSEEGGDR
jgi:arsenate reductase (thioredoxin)